MTVEQLQLVDVPAAPVTSPIKLTDRQRHALRALIAAGYDGLHTDELGAIVHAFAGKHSLDERCEWCGSAGQEIGKALRRKQLAQQRRRRAPGGDTVTVWTVAGKLTRPRDTSHDRIPF